MADKNRFLSRNPVGGLCFHERRMVRNNNKVMCFVADISFGNQPEPAVPAVPAELPILVLASERGFGTYTGEILKAEGLNLFQIESPPAQKMNLPYLGAFDVVILTEATLDAVQNTILTRYVEQGGNLIAFRPDKKLAKVFGLAAAQGCISDGYVKFEASHEIGKGLISDPMQFHGEADLYDLKSAAVIASLWSPSKNLTGKPAVTINRLGIGLAVAFTYNLPKSIVYTRQGNNRYANQERDGIKGIRAADMFTDGWIDTSKNSLNQADEQMRLLSRIIEWLSSSKKPLPRLWYFPELNKSLVMLTGDGEDSPESDFDAHLADLKSKNVRMTLYQIGTYIPASKVKSWVSDGFEISSHVDDTDEATSPTFSRMNSKVQSAVSGLGKEYGLKMLTVRNHWIVWCGETADGQQDFAAQAAIEASHGIRLDCNQYHFDQESSQGHFLGPIGNFTGSGLPMRFANCKGDVLDIFGLVTQLPDEQWGAESIFNNFRTLLDRSLDEERYTFINTNFHTNRWKGQMRMEGLRVLDYANSRGVPVWTAQQLLQFLEMKDTARFTDIAWSNGTLTFHLNAPMSGEGLTVMIPKSFGGGTISRITRDEVNQSFALRNIKGTEYALMTTSSGNWKFIVSY